MAVKSKVTRKSGVRIATRVRTPAKPKTAPKILPKVRTPAKPTHVSVKTSTGKIRLPESVLKKSDHPPLYDTLSMLGLFLACLRTQDESIVDLAMAYIPGFIRDLKHYNIPFPARELEDVRHYSVTGKWANAYKSLQKFSNEFGPDFRRAINADNSVKSEAISIAGSFLDMIAARDPSRWNALESAAIAKFKYLGNPQLAQVWRVKIEGDQETEMEKLAHVVELAFGAGRRGAAKYTLAFKEKAHLLKTNPDLNKAYNEAYNAAIKKYRAALRNYVLDHGDVPQPIPEARAKMESEGFLLHELPKELDDLEIGSDGFYYLDHEGEMLKIIQRPQPGTIIGKFNEDYNPTEKGKSWVFLYKTEEGEWIHAYTELTKRTYKTEKSDDIIPMLDSVPSKRPEWIKDMSSPDNEIAMNALLTEICYTACSRIGGKGFTKGFGTTYGLSTLLVDHCYVEKDRVVLEYPGKGFGKNGSETSVMQTHTFTDANRDEHRIAQKLRACVRSKKPTDPLFTYTNGKPVTAAHVRDYMKTLGIPHLVPHKMRSIRGTAALQTLLKKYSSAALKKLPVGGAEKLFKEEALEVGKLLGHAAGGKVTSATAIAAYIDPSFTQNWFVNHGLRVPLWAKTTLNDLD
jgi:hypothetical protein